VEECYHITGEEDYLLKVRCMNTQHLDEFLTHHLKKIPGIVRTKTTIALSTQKERASSLLIKGKKDGP
jgi:Lrp/AsnC family leucine-responsive transcriptional regulator